jgi:hypothetical protein
VPPARRCADQPGTCHNATVEAVRCDWVINYSVQTWFQLQPHMAAAHEIEVMRSGDGSKKAGRGKMPNAKSIGWAIYAAGFSIWLFGYLSVGHASIFRLDAVTPWWISSFVPNREAELGFALMFASMVPIYCRAGRKRA